MTDHTPDATDGGTVTGPHTVGPVTTSVLWPSDDHERTQVTVAPDGLGDLNLDQVIGAALALRPDDDLAALYSTPLRGPGAIAYRQAVCGDLRRDEVRTAVDRFVAGMRRAGRYRRLSQATRGVHERHLLLVHSARAYLDAVTDLTSGLHPLPLRSAGLQRIRDHLQGYVASGPYDRLDRDSRRILGQLDTVRFRVHALEGTVTVQPPDPAAVDYREEILALFDRFRHQAASHPPRSEAADELGLDHVETQIIDRVARLHPEVFAGLAAFSREYATHQDPTVERFHREVPFYLAFLDLVAPIESRGLPMCFPSFGDGPLLLADTFDLALAHVHHDRAIVPNDIRLEEGERTVVITGANQGGKTTLARTIGQIHYLAALGLPVPGREAHVRIRDRILTHFPREERLDDLRGRLQDDLIRARAILEQAGPDSLVIVNEAFASTTVADARTIATRIIEHLHEHGGLCVYVTFIDELADVAPNTATFVAAVDPDDPTTRTFRLVRRRPDGRAYALAIAAKYGLTHEQLQRTLPR